MGAEPWEYFVPWESSVESALEKLRQKVFASGNFHRSELKPKTIDEALCNADADGTRSILDISDVGEEPDFGTVGRLPDSELEAFYGTARPTRDMVEADMPFYENIERGQGVYFVVYDKGEPSEYFFGGYSFD